MAEEPELSVGLESAPEGFAPTGHSFIAIGIAGRSRDGIGAAPKMAAAFGGRLKRLLEAGPDISDERKARRIYLVNIVALCGAATCAFFVCYNYLTGRALTDKFVLQTIVFFFLFASVLVFSRYLNRYAVAYVFVLVLAVTVSQALQGGRDAGTNYFLFVLGPVLPLFLGSRRILLVSVLTMLAVLIFLAIEFTMPALVSSARPWLPQILQTASPNRSISTSTTRSYLMFAFQAILTRNVAAMRRRKTPRRRWSVNSASEILLQSTLPRPIAARLKDTPDAIIADEFDLVTVLFADVVDFIAVSASKAPEATVRFLDPHLRRVRPLAEKHGLEKIKTIGNSYMVAGGMP